MEPNVIGYMICETAAAEDSDAKIVGETKSKKPIAEAILQDADVLNRNGRWYSQSDLFPELTSPRTQELVNAGYFRGESGHPLAKDIARQQTIDPTNVCCKYLKLWTEGNMVKCHVTGTNNDLGKAFNADLEDGDKPAFSLRALGTVENTKRGAEVKNLKIITYDHVIFPSHKVAYVQKLVTESTSLTESNKLVVEKTDAGIFVPINNQQVIDYIKSESKNIKTIKESFGMLFEDITMLKNGYVQMTDRQGHTMIVTLEQQIQNEIYGYCSNRYF